MSTFENDSFRWRETYFVLFASNDRPTADQVEQALGRLSDRFELIDVRADDQGRFESLTLLSPEDFAALDICYVAGEEVLEQGSQLADDLKMLAAPDEMSRIEKIPAYDARLDVLHFQDVTAAASQSEDEMDEMFDPSALLIVLEALVELTHGIAVDPQSGSLV